MRGCLHQIFRPPPKSRPLGWGDCEICQADKRNDLCPGYQPVEVTIRRLGVLAIVKANDGT